MRLMLVSPTFRDTKSRAFRAMMMRYYFPVLSLPMIAAATPDEYQIRFVDELFEPIDFDEPVDVVGITASTAQAPRAYEIADLFRARGIPVIIGGIHASSLPHEAKAHADAVVIGEGELLWPQVLADLKSHRLQAFYSAETLVSMEQLPWPRYDIFDQRKIPRPGTTNSVQTTRGCPYDCSFCAVTAFFGRKFRTRPVADVVHQVASMPENHVVFVDDNIIGNRQYARTLFSELKHLGIVWSGQASIDVARDPDLLQLAAESGCRSLLIGLESISPENIEAVHKRQNKVHQYVTAIRTIQDSGIDVMGSFIFGLDHDDQSTFDRTLEFVQKSGLRHPLFNILTPFPGTREFDRLESEGRILTTDWSRYTSTNVVFEPKRLTPEQLQEGYDYAYREVHRIISQQRAPYLLSGQWS